MPWQEILTKPTSIQVVERGSHHELVELGGKYAEMWRIQNVEDEEGSRTKSEQHLILSS